jgi:hypothetical protein
VSLCHEDAARLSLGAHRATTHEPCRARLINGQNIQLDRCFEILQLRSRVAAASDGTDDDATCIYKIRKLVTHSTETSYPPSDPQVGVLAADVTVADIYLRGKGVGAFVANATISVDNSTFTRLNVTDSGYPIGGVIALYGDERTAALIGNNVTFGPGNIVRKNLLSYNDTARMCAAPVSAPSPSASGMDHAVSSRCTQALLPSGLHASPEVGT